MVGTGELYRVIFLDFLKLVNFAKPLSSLLTNGNPAALHMVGPALLFIYPILLKLDAALHMVGPTLLFIYPILLKFDAALHMVGPTLLFIYPVLLKFDAALHMVDPPLV